MKLRRPPLLTIACLLTAATIVTLPVMMSRLPETMGTFITLYPLEACGASLLAWIAWPRRRDLAVILLVVAWLTFGAMWLPLLAP